MPRVASIIPPDSKGSLTLCNGTQVLLDNGEYLQHVNKITLVAEPGQPWKAIIEVHPTNQEQIDALLSDLKVTKRNDAFNRLYEIQEEMQHLQDEKLFLEHKYLSGVTGVSIDGVKDVPKEGTWLLHGHETVLTPQQNESLKEILNINSQIGVVVGRHATTAKMTNEDFKPLELGRNAIAKTVLLNDGNEHVPPQVIWMLHAHETELSTQQLTGDDSE